MKNKKIECQEIIIHKTFLCFHADIPKEHKWIYMKENKRKCEICGRKEIFFGHIYGTSGRPLEDWRKCL